MPVQIFSWQSMMLLRQKLSERAWTHVPVSMLQSLILLQEIGQWKPDYQHTWMPVQLATLQSMMLLWERLSAAVGCSTSMDACSNFNVADQDTTTEKAISGT